jgi:MtN3 and saliva related transmembrane protein
MPDAIGWLSSLILLATIGKQIYKQWHDESSRGVSRWLFVGQTAASLGFTIYSVLVNNWVFVVTNALLLLAGVTGLAITVRHQRRSARRSRAEFDSRKEANSYV